MFIVWAFVTTVIAILHHGDGEVFTATTNLKRLVQLEANLLSIFAEFITHRQIESKFLQKQYVLRKRQHLQIMATDRKLHQPLNAYRTIKSLTIDWLNIENAMRKTATPVQMFDLAAITSHPMFPSYHDFTGAVVGLVGLQETYKLETSFLANGIINGVDYGSNLTASDCFELGRELYHTEYYNRSVDWLKVALTKYEQEGLKSVEKLKIMEHLAYALYKSGNPSSALEVIDHVLHEKRLPEMVKSNVVQWKSEVELENLEEHQQAEKEVIENKADHKAVCRGESMPTPEEVAHLKCKLLIRNQNFLTAFKVEELHVHPSFVAYMYHDVLSDREISIAIAEAKDRLTRSMVFNDDGSSSVSEQRTAKRYNVPETDKISAFVNRRIEDMTGFNLKMDYELSQIINYGIGGQYLPHFDCFGSTIKGDVFPKHRGDRIATVMFYLSDVEQGGATAFPLVNVLAKPEKGSALVWYNLLPNGQPNAMTEHCGCPVIVGSKWIWIKWIYERDQVFTRPCTIDNYFWKM